MKKCPHCAEEIQDEAVICRFCQRNVSNGAIASMAAERPLAPTWHPGTAAVLSFFIPGLGHIYKGQVGSGIVIFIVTIIGYLMLIVPGVVMHLVAIFAAYSGQPGAVGGYLLKCASCAHLNRPGPSKCDQCGFSLKGRGSTVVHAPVGTR